MSSKDHAAYRMLSMKVTLLISFNVVSPAANLVQRRLAQEAHAFIAGRAANFGCRLFGQNHLANAVAQIQEFVDRATAAEPRTRAFDATLPFVERYLAPLRRVETAGFQDIIRIFDSRPAGIRRSNEPAAAPECSSERKRSYRVRLPCSGNVRLRRPRYWRGRW